VHIPDHLPDAELESGAGEPPPAGSHPAFAGALNGLASYYVTYWRDIPQVAPRNLFDYH